MTVKYLHRDDEHLPSDNANAGRIIFHRQEKIDLLTRLLANTYERDKDLIFGMIKDYER